MTLKINLLKDDLEYRYFGENSTRDECQYNIQGVHYDSPHRVLIIPLPINRRVEHDNMSCIYVNIYELGLMYTLYIIYVYIYSYIYIYIYIHILPYMYLFLHI